MEEILYLGKPDSYHLRHFAEYLNTHSSADPLYKKAQDSFAFIANRIALRRAAERDAIKDLKRFEVASKLTS